MGISAVGIKTSLADLKVLPKDLDSVVGKTRVLVIEFFAGINAFFKVLFFGPWKDFWKNVNTEKLQMANVWKVARYKLVNFEKMKPHEQAFIKLTGYEVYTPQDVAGLKKFEKDFNVYKMFRATVSEKDCKKLDSLLKVIEKTNAQNYYPVLVSLQSLAQDRSVSKEVRDLINDKLKQISKEARISVIYMPQSPHTYSMWKKVAVGVCILAGIIAVGLVGSKLYQGYFKTLDIMPSSDIKKPPVDEKIMQTSTADKTIISTPETLDLSKKTPNGVPQVNEPPLNSYDQSKPNNAKSSKDLLLDHQSTVESAPIIPDQSKPNNVKPSGDYPKKRRVPKGN